LTFYHFVISIDENKCPFFKASSTTQKQPSLTEEKKYEEHLEQKRNCNVMIGN